MARSRSWVTGTSLSALWGMPATSGGSSGRSGSLPMQWMTSARTPSTPRSSQKRSTSCMASSTAGWSQLRSGWPGSKRCRYHWPDAASRVQAGAVRSKDDTQLLGGAPSGVASRHTYQSRWAWSAARPGVEEPGVLVGGVVGDPVDDHLEPEGVGLATSRSNSSRVPKQRIDVAVVADVVAEVDHRRAVEGRDPQGIDAQPGQVGQMGPDAAQVADPVPVGVGERAGVDLVEDGRLPPRRLADAVLSVATGGGANVGWPPAPSPASGLGRVLDPGQSDLHVGPVERVGVRGAADQRCGGPEQPLPGGPRTAR